MTRWHLEESTTEDGTLWNILEERGGLLHCIAQCLDEARAQQVVSALKWVDAMGGTHMSLAMEGVTFDPKTGLPRPKAKPRARKPREEVLEIIFEPERPKRRRK